MSATVRPFPLGSESVGMSGRPRLRAVARALALVLGAALLAAAIIHAAGSDARAARALPPATRAALHARTMRNLESLCTGDARFAVRGFCHDQARLALALPECDAACADVARAALRTPTR